MIIIVCTRLSSCVLRTGLELPRLIFFEKRQNYETRVICVDAWLILLLNPMYFNFIFLESVPHRIHVFHPLNRIAFQFHRKTHLAAVLFQPFQTYGTFSHIIHHWKYICRGIRNREKVTQRIIWNRSMNLIPLREKSRFMIRWKEAPASR